MPFIFDSVALRGGISAFSQPGYLLQDLNKFLFYPIILVANISSLTLSVTLDLPPLTHLFKKSQDFICKKDFNVSCEPNDG